MPVNEFQLEKDEWFYFVNYYGQFTNENIGIIKKSMVE